MSRYIETVSIKQLTSEGDRLRRDLEALADRHGEVRYRMQSVVNGFVLFGTVLVVLPCMIHVQKQYPDSSFFTNLVFPVLAVVLPPMLFTACNGDLWLAHLLVKKGQLRRREEILEVLDRNPGFHDALQDIDPDLCESLNRIISSR